MRRLTVPNLIPAEKGSDENRYPRATETGFSG